MGKELRRGHPKEIALNMQSMKLLGLNDGENRKASKPLIEKRRRARINYSLAELKAIVVGTETPHSPAARPPKLEKADILEMAVVYVKKIQERQSSNPEGDHRGYASGYNQCLMEVCQFLDKKIDQDLKQRLVMHLNNSSNAQLTASETSMDDTSSSCSSTSRSQTPASITMESSYMSTSPFTDSEQEVPKTFTSDSYQTARQSPTDSYQTAPSNCNYPADSYQKVNHSTANSHQIVRPSPINSYQTVRQPPVDGYQTVRQSPVNTYKPPSAENYQHSSYVQNSSSYVPFKNSSTNAINENMDLAHSADPRRDNASFPQAGAACSKSQLEFFNSKMDSDSMWRPW